MQVCTWLKLTGCRKLQQHLQRGPVWEEVPSSNYLAGSPTTEQRRSMTGPESGFQDQSGRLPIVALRTARQCPVFISNRKAWSSLPTEAGIAYKITLLPALAEVPARLKARSARLGCGHERGL